MTEALIETDPSQGRGHALIRIPRGARGLVDPRFRLSRDGHEAGTLGPGGWQVADALITPAAACADGNDLVLTIGPTVVDTIESGVVVLAVPSIGFDEPVFWPDLPLSLSSQGVATIAVPAPAPAQPPPIEGRRKIEPTPPSSPPSPVPPPLAIDASRRQRSPLFWLAAGFLPIALAASVLWWVTRLHPPASPVAQASPTARDCTTGSIQDLVACAPDANTLYRQAEQRWDGGQVNDGLVLMQIAAERGSGAAALRLAQLYDPATFRPGGPIPHASTREAAKYYRRAAQAHQDGGEAPRQTLRRRLQGDADAGDTLAELTLKDFWP